MKRYVLLVCTGYCIATMQLISAQNAQQPLDTIQYMNAEDIHNELVGVDTDNLGSIDGNQIFRKTKGYLDVDYLNVNQYLVVKGQQIIGSGQGGALSAAYGQLSLSSEEINLRSPDTWVPIPFTTTSPSSSVTISTDSPATITIQRSGVYQITFSAYLLVEVSDETIFEPSIYTFGLNVNDTTTPATSVFAGESGYYSLNYNVLMTLAANDYLQFNLKSSSGFEDFANNVTLENCSAYIVQIAN